MSEYPIRNLCTHATLFMAKGKVSKGLTWNWWPWSWHGLGLGSQDWALLHRLWLWSRYLVSTFAVELCKIVTRVWSEVNVHSTFWETMSLRRQKTCTRGWLGHRVRLSYHVPCCSPSTAPRPGDQFRTSLKGKFDMTKEISQTALKST